MTAVKKPKNIYKTVEEDGFNFFDHSVLPQSIIEKLEILYLSVIGVLVILKDSFGKDSTYTIILVLLLVLHLYAKDVGPIEDVKNVREFCLLSTNTIYVMVVGVS